MNQASLLNAANYTMLAKVKKGKKTNNVNVGFTVSSPSNNSVILTLTTKQKFTLGGTITISNPPSGGITSAANAGLKTSYTLVIAPNLKGITI